MSTPPWAPQEFSETLQGRECPNPPGDADIVEDSAGITQTMEQRKIDNNYLYSILFLAMDDGDGAQK